MAADCVTSSPVSADAMNSTTSTPISSAAAPAPVEKSIQVGEEAKQALTKLMPPPPPRPPRAVESTPSVLEEDDWTNGLETIVERDFFPELTKQKLRLQWLTALRTQDTEELRRVQLAASTPVSRNATPSMSTLNSRAGVHGGGTGAESDGTRGGTKGGQEEEDEYVISGRKAEAALAAGVPLDEFCNRFTSEDNASFHEIVQRESALRMSKTSTLIESQVNENLKALPGAARATDGYGSTGQPDGQLQHWNFNPTNALMYYPAMKGPSVPEKLASGPKKQVLHANTRFRPLDSMADSAASTPTTATGNSTPAFSDIGTPVRPNSVSRPQNEAGGGQWDVVRTPVIEPGADGESPLITWGNIDSTPLRITDGDAEKFATQVRFNSSHSFRINDLSKRERISRELFNKADRSIAKKRRQNSVIKSHQGTPTRTPLRSPLSSGRGKKAATPARSPAPSLSDAGKKLAMAYSSRNGNDIDRELRSKYTATPPRHRSLRTEPPRSKTVPSARTPQNNGISKLPVQKDDSRKAHITDGLLQM